MHENTSRRRLDHLVMPARDLEAMGAFYARLGFQVGARNRHPWGTENRLVQFNGTFLELITLGEGAAPPPHGPHHFSFGHHVADWLAQRGDGLSMAVLSSPDAAADAAWFRQAGIGDYAPFQFARSGKRPDGSAMEVAFTLAFAKPSAASHLSFFVCQQHFPENFWNAAFQSHENTATGVARVVMTHPRPRALSGFLKAYAGGEPVLDGDDGLSFGLSGSALSVWSPEAARKRLADDPALFNQREAQLAAIVFNVANLARTQLTLLANNVPHRMEGARLIVPSGAAFGTLLVFMQESP
jgi:catechol 2,3-dioxygenase-like lactoylglutathione lyase family enzyme